MRNAARLVLLLLPPLLALALHPRVAPAGSITSPFRFRTIETEHFSVHFHEGLEESARRAAGLAERAHARMAPDFGWAPAEKTQLVLVDAFDFPNGLAASLPYNAITVFPVPPDLDSTIGESGSWLEALIVHEYAHVLTGDPARGYSRVTRKIFGKPLPGTDPLSLLGFLAAAPPNTFLPRWWHEGMATWAESAYTARGRDNSVYFDMVYRMDVLEGKVPSIDRINETLPFWPYGNLPYLYGSRLVSHLVRTRGGGVPGALNLAHAGRFPYFLNGAPERLFDRVSYEALYREAIFALDREQRARIARLRAEPPTEPRVLSSDGERLLRPRFSPDGKRIAWTRRDPHGHDAIVVAAADGSNAREIARRLPSDGALSWSPDGRTLFFCQAEVVDGFKTYQDLYAVDPESGKVRRLTWGLRLSEADAGPGGGRFAAIVAGSGGRNLAVLAPDERGGWTVDDVTRLSGMRLSGPRWSPDGGEIAYVSADEEGSGGLFVYDLAGRRSRRLVGSAAPLASPAWSPDGRFVLYVSGETGVFNLFAVPAAGGAPRQVTHLLGGAFHPDVSPDGASVAWSDYHARGFRVVAAPYRPEDWRASPGPSIREAAAAAPGGGAAAGAAAPEPPPASRPYSPFPTVLPRFWLPVLLFDRDGAAPGAFTAGADALRRHLWLAEGAVGLSSGEGYFAAAYANDSFRPTLRLSVHSLPLRYSDLFRRGDYWERGTGLTAEAVLPFDRIESGLRLHLGYELRRQEALSPLRDGRFEGLPVFEGRRDNLFAKFSWSDALRYPRSIGEEEGRRISIAFRDYGRRWGSDLEGGEAVASWEEFRGLPWRATRHHVVALSLRGGLSDGERPLQGAFLLGGPPGDLVEFPLRGYPSRFRGGERIAAGSIEYRAPMLDLFRGWGTRPLFLDRLHGALFVDGGRTWGDGSDGETRIGAGAEARLDLTLGYWLPVTPALGFAHGFDEDGTTSAYFVLRALPR